MPKTSTYEVTRHRVVCAVHAHVYAGGRRRKMMEEVCGIKYPDPQTLKSATLEVVSNAINRQNSKRLLKWLLSLKNEHVPTLGFVERHKLKN